MKKFILFLILNFSFLIALFSQTSSIKCYPTNWWVGMKNPKLELLIHGTNVGYCNQVRINYPGIKITRINKVENKNYLFVDLVISSDTKPGSFSIDLVNKEKMEPLTYQLKSRRFGNRINYAQGLPSKPFLYLVMPARFSTAATSNHQFTHIRHTLA